MGYKKDPNVFSDKVMSVAEAAYLAGLVDGEGTIGLRHKFTKGSKPHQFHPALKIANTNLGLLRTVVEMSGNGIIFVRRRPIGQKFCYDYSLCANQIRHVLPQIVPYLVAKKRQADLVLEFLSMIRTYFGANEKDIPRILEIKEELSVLNQRGTLEQEEEGLFAEELTLRCVEPDCSQRQYKNTVYCYQHWLVRREARFSNCEWCGKEMLVVLDKKQYCSHACWGHAYYQGSVKPKRDAVASEREPTPCPACGKLVDQAGYKGKVFCDDRCYQKFKYVPKETTQITCEICDKQFVPKGRQIHCTPACRNKAYRSRKKSP